MLITLLISKQPQGTDHRCLVSAVAASLISTISGSNAVQSKGPRINPLPILIWASRPLKVLTTVPLAQEGLASQDENSTQAESLYHRTTSQSVQNLQMQYSSSMASEKTAHISMTYNVRTCPIIAIPSRPEGTANGNLDTLGDLLEGNF